MPKKWKPLSEVEWSALFELRCKAKRGLLSPGDEAHKLFERAFRTDGIRYAAMNRKIHEVTAPFGSVQQESEP